ncbi:carboxypeptidase regulatory-like domain-containing protein [Myxococcus sp. K15C18031901]|uniref:carboxypeptidase regulatory-like domain-containing protein n=1 Tax=Myxococcus dinghuensis TaxID=2906761 RepID=UPI0020A809E4|nr:carboxypeptidase regulatory-like domain-containing protein [Myxococcus dinghuensis]MCP3097400.1 carboxypeptidase regulatory-like domain-containing protein [Myxococcus dinghuensis]
MSSRFVSRQWLSWYGALVGAMVVGAACGVADVEPEASEAPQSQTLATCTRVTGAITICGVVRTPTGGVLAGAQVDFNGVRTTTAADGSFSVSSSTTMGAPLTILAPGYMPHVGAVTRDVLGAAFVLQTLYQQTFTGGTAAVTDPRSGAGITVNLEALTSATGQVVRPFTVGVRHIDTGLLAMPGADGAFNTSGRPVFLETRGAIYTEVRDARGALLSLRPGATAQVFIPITKDMAGAAPSGIALWSMPVGTNQWLQQPTTATKTTTPGGCQQSDRGSCSADDCARLSGQRYTGPTNEIGFVNADIEKVNPACLRIEVDTASLPSGTTLPICLDLEIAIPTGGTQTRTICVDGGTDIVYNLPPNANITVSRSSAYGCPPPPGTSVSVNTGAPWGGTNAPSSPSQCNGVLKIPPLP